MPASNLKAFFGFTRHPFPPSCPPEPLLRTPPIEAAIEKAKAALASRLNVLVTAPAGLGKSVFLRLLVAEMNPRDLRAVRVIGQALGSAEIVQKLCEELGLPTSSRRSGAVKHLVAGLRRQAPSAPLPVLVLDEAQNVPIPAIDLVRLVAEESVPPLLGMVLAGDDGFRRALSIQAHAPLAGRFAVHLRLGPLSETETAAFIEHAFKAVAMVNVLAPTSVAAVYAAAGGVPREIGAILTRALMRAFEKRSRLLTDEIVQEVLDEPRH